jgi:hypothetical protein
MLDSPKIYQRNASCLENLNGYDMEECHSLRTVLVKYESDRKPNFTKSDHA